MQSVGNVASVRRTRARSDRILPETRWVSAIIVPFLVAAFVILYLFPDHTQALFAWGIQPRMSAMMLGAAYIGGAYFFVRAAVDARWHWIKVGFLPVTTFAALLGIATILHWNRFHHGSLSFFAWAGLYFTTPFIVFLLWLRNRATDPGPTSHDLLVPRPVRLVIGIVGGLTLLTSTFLFLQPGFTITIWPWQLTPLTARVMGALFALTGVGELAIALDARWSAVRIPLQSQMIGIVLIGLAMVFSWSNFHQANPLTWIFLASIVFLLLASPLVYLWMETRGNVRDRAARVQEESMSGLPATLGASDEHYRRLGVSRGSIEAWEDGMRTDGGKGSYEWWYFDAYLNDGSKLAITFRTKPIIDVGKALDPWIDVNLERADGTSLVKHLHISPQQFTAARETCDVAMGSNFFKGDLHTYSIHVDAEGTVIDVSLTGTTAAWRPETGCLFFGEREEYYFAWLPSVPQGDAHITMAIDGGNPQDYTGIGYHDHNWGNISMLKLMHDWYWARGKIANYSLIASYITAEQRYGSKTFPVFMLARDGKVIADDATRVRFSTRDVAIEPDTGKPVAHQVIYEYTEGAERYVLTFTREKDTLHYKFIEELHGIKALLARLIRVDGAYLRFTGELSLEHYHADQLVETQRDEALWELMYFGHVTEK